jgi:hypothetical protein
MDIMIFMCLQSVARALDSVITAAKDKILISSFRVFLSTMVYRIASSTLSSARARAAVSSWLASSSIRSLHVLCVFLEKRILDHIVFGESN